MRKTNNDFCLQIASINELHRSLMVNGNNERLTSNDHYYMARSRLYSRAQNNLWSTRKTWKTFGVDAAQNETTDACRFKASKLPSGIEPNGSTNRKHCGKARSHIQKMQVLKPSEPPSFHVYPPWWFLLTKKIHLPTNEWYRSLIGIWGPGMSGKRPTVVYKFTIFAPLRSRNFSKKHFSKCWNGHF